MKNNLQIENLTEVEPAIIRRAKEAGFHYIDTFAITSPVDMAKSLELEISEAISICNKAALKLEEIGIIPSSKISSFDRKNQSSKSKLYIKTGSIDFDQLFGGNGIETRAVTHFYGKSLTGKTQICHTLCVIIQELHPDYKSIYIDTEGTFREKRIVEIAKVKGLDPTRILQNIRCIQPLNSARLESILQQDLSLILNQDSGIKLLIIDSIINLYRADYSGRSMLSQRQSRLSKMMHLLQSIARMYDIAIVITNQVSTSVDGGFCLADSDRPMGGNVMTHTSTFTIQLRGNSSYRIAEMKGSPCYPETQTHFEIYEGGVRSAS